ncbi:MAG TPA: molybdenum cofactor guanylyltransferase [Candidatus Eremiobacteraceae bacterium]|nr:molybdenum cofactor guanylyltransferase [Candidatus Eremiobacteraceae bacterium]
MIRYGFVQAGGGSTRLGTDKALLQLAGKTMLARTVELLSKVCEDVSIVAPAGKYSNEYGPVLPDRWPGQGPLGGILTALHHINQLVPADPSPTGTRDPLCAWALIVSCDMPFLTAPFLTFLWQHASASPAHVVLPQSQTGLEPLCACWRADAADLLQGAFDEGIRKVAQAMTRLHVEVLDGSAWKRFDSGYRLFWNINTPADFAEARRTLGPENNE